MEVWQLDTVTGKAAVIDTAVNNDGDYDAAWSPDSKWLAYTQSLANRLHALFLYSVTSGKSTQITDGMSDVRFPAFDRGGKYLYFTESTNYGTYDQRAGHEQRRIYGHPQRGRPGARCGYALAHCAAE